MTSSGSRQITCSRCGREYPAAFWRAHEHNADRAHCVEPGCAEFAVGYAIRGMNPLCGTHLVQRRRREHEVRFVDGGMCTACRGYGQVAPEGESSGLWERCPMCWGSGYLDEERLSQERSRTEEEQLAEYRHRSELRREIEEGIARRREEERLLNERRRMEIERARQYEESRLRALSGQPPESGSGDGDGGGTTGTTVAEVTATGKAEVDDVMDADVAAPSRWSSPSLRSWSPRLPAERQPSSTWGSAVNCRVQHPPRRSRRRPRRPLPCPRRPRR